MASGGDASEEKPGGDASAADSSEEAQTLSRRERARLFRERALQARQGTLVSNTPSFSMPSTTEDRVDPLNSPASVLPPVVSSDAEPERSRRGFRAFRQARVETGPETFGSASADSTAVSGDNRAQTKALVARSEEVSSSGDGAGTIDSDDSDSDRAAEDSETVAPKAPNAGEASSVDAADAEAVHDAASATSAHAAEVGDQEGLLADDRSNLEHADMEARAAPEQAVLQVPGKFSTFMVQRGRSLGAFAFLTLACVGLYYALKPKAKPVDATVVTSAAEVGTGALPASSEEPAPTAAPEPTPRAKLWRVRSLSGEANVQEAAVGKRTLTAALSAMGVPKTETARILKAFAGIRSFDKCAPRDNLVVALSREEGKPKVVGFEYELSRTDVLQAREVDGKLVGKRLRLNFDKAKKYASFLLMDDPRKSVQDASYDLDLVRAVDEALDGHITMDNMKRGSRLRVVTEELRLEGAFIGYGEVHAIEYLPPTKNPAHPPKALRVYGFALDAKTVNHYDAHGKQPYHGGFRMPIPMARISSRFNPKRMHPVLHKVMPHNGIDFAGSTGTPIYSVGPGILKQAKDTGPCGNTVQIQHAGGILSIYCHLSKFAPGLQAEKKIEAKELIGYVGATGRVTGPHLHFAIKKNGKFIDPMELKMGDEKSVPNQKREEFSELRKKYDGELDAIPLPTPAAVASENESLEEEVLDEMADDGQDLEDPSGTEARSTKESPNEDAPKKKKKKK
jgi:murein DD-endopeptidase MepM/ murein hydrolase activator NlpD